MREKQGIGKLLFEALKEWIRDRSTSIAAAITHSQFLSLAPLTGFILFISFKILGDERTHNDVIPLLKHWFTPQFVKVVTYMLEQTEEVDPSSLQTLTVLAGLALIWATKEYFEQIKIAIEVTWNSRRYKFGLKHLFKRTIETFKIAGGFLCIAIAYIFLRAIMPHPYITEEGNTGNSFLIHSIQWAIQFLLIFSLLLYLFIYLAPVKVQWKNAIPGSMLGAFLFLIGRAIMRMHMSERPDAELAESLIVVMLWFYYANLIFTYAAEFNRVYVANRQDIDVYSLKLDI